MKYKIELDSNQRGYLIALLEVENFREEKDLIDKGDVDPILIIESKEVVNMNDIILKALRDSDY